ncbi:hypothetical protein [Vibrio barjaei]|uniref:hypothetical protein n=1 Tax=Vibrio barjaei TaxID=1676683 RepID=UPI00228521FB|nr:hypothetical protein [Vibrio barjaei]MCY9872662.1 hypothetical protein [Vibrio barjaei]
MKKNQSLLAFVLFLFASQAYALSNGECTFNNQKLTYTGVNLPSLNDIYKDGEVLGQLTLSASYSCKTYHVTNVGGNAGVVLQIGVLGARHSYLGGNRYKSNVSGITLESSYVKQVAGYNNELHLVRFSKPAYSNQQNVNGVLNLPIFDVIKSGKISSANSVSLNLNSPFYLTSHLYDSGDGYGIFMSPNSVPNTAPIPVYNASCNVTHPTNVQVPALVKGVRDEVSSYFNIALNCADKSVMQNNVQLTVTPVNMTNVSLSSDKSTLLYNGNSQMVIMNIFNNLGSESQMLFSTMYEFSNDSQGSSFTIPMRAKFQLGSSSGYGNFSFQTQITVRYN